MSQVSVHIRGASKMYGRVVGLLRADLEIGPGITGLLGPNGAGKSTLMKLVSGQLTPTSGSIELLGRGVRRSTRARRQLGFAPEVDSFYEDMSPRTFVQLMARLSGLSWPRARSETTRVLELTGLVEPADKVLRACSKGMRQRVKVAQALVHDPEVLVLDEPLNGVDPKGRKELLELFDSLGRAGKTLIISSHILDEIETVTDRIVLIAQGRVLAAGALAQIRGLLSEYPLTVHISCDRPRQLGAVLIERGLVEGAQQPCRVVSPAPRTAPSGVEFGDLIVKVRRTDEFFAALPAVLVELHLEVERIEPLDDSAEAVFNYLVEGASPEARQDRF